MTLVQGFEANQWIATWVKYDVRGNAQKQSEPYFALNSTSGALQAVSNATIYYSTTLFDHLNRPYSVTRPADSVAANGTPTTTTATTTMAYQGLQTVTTLPPNKSGIQQTITKVVNAMGDVVTSTDADSTTLTYHYDAIGNVVEVSQPDKTISTSFDTLGRKIGMVDPDMGTWVYTVNHAGETIRQVSARGTCTENRYDGRGRVWERNDYTNAACSVLETKSEWNYDTAPQGRGALAWEQTTVGGVQKLHRDVSYDGYGRPVSVTTLLDGKNYVARSTFDEYGRPYQSFFLAPGVAETGELTEYNAQGSAFRVRSAFGGSSGLVYSAINAVNAGVR